MAWKLEAPKDWQTGVIIPIYKKSDHKECTNYQRISLFSFQERCMQSALEKKCREIVESKLKYGRCGFRPGCNITDRIFTLKQILEKCWEYAKDVFAWFVDLQKAYDQVSKDKLSRVLQEYGIDGHLLMYTVSHSTVSLKFVFV